MIVRKEQEETMSLNLSKTKYCQAVQCPKMLWLKEHMPEQFDDSVINQAVMDAGSAVGDLAMGLFGDFVEVPYGDLSGMIAETKRLLAAGTPVIAEASFASGDLFCSVDILKNRGDGRVEMYEVKSSTSVKDIYLHDAAYQRYVLDRAGLQVEGCYLVVVNNEYERIGALELSKLFKVVDVTEKTAEKLPGVAERIDFLRAYMQQTQEPADDISPGCFLPYACGFFGYCTRSLPKPNVFDLAGMQAGTKMKHYEQGRVSLAELGRSEKLNGKAAQQIRHALSDLPDEIDRDQIRSFLDTLSFPLYFLDFESFAPAVPLFDRSHPYEQIVFQYSLHYMEREDGELLHKEYLAWPGGDPRRGAAEQLVRDIPADVCVLAYNMTFEKTVIKKLAGLYSDLHDHLMSIHDNVRDLMIPFQKRYYYNRAMQGSFSIKYVLPALYPNDESLDYHNLEGVHNGAEASEMFAKMGDMTPEELETHRRELLAYCGLDTFAMVKVWEKLREVIQ